VSPDSKANVVAAIAGLAFLIALIGAANDSDAVMGTAGSERPLPAPNASSSYEVPSDRILGAEDASVTIIEYASLTCGHCGQFHATTFKELKEAYIDTGKVRWIFREFPTPPAERAVAGFLLARCVSEDRYFGFLDVLFKQQVRWVTAENTYEELKKIAMLSGMNDETFTTCLNNEAEVERIQQVTEYAQHQYDIDSTPSFVINGTKYTNMNFQQFQSILDPLIGE
jgi:protein-disulfide isomerase